MTRSTRLPSQSHALARRSIPVVQHAPTQLVLGLRWDNPIDRIHAMPAPEPVAPVLLIRRKAA